MKYLPTWLRAPLTLALGLVFRNNKLPVDMAPVIVGEMFAPPPPPPPMPSVPQIPRVDHVTLDDADGVVDLTAPTESSDPVK